MDGHTATTKIRSSGVATQLPIIALTGSCTAEDRQRCQEEGFQGFLTKPIVVKELVDALRIHCGRFSKQQSSTQSNGRSDSAARSLASAFASADSSDAPTAANGAVATA